MSVGLWRVAVDGRSVLARGPVDHGPAELLDLAVDVDDLLADEPSALTRALEASALGPVPPSARLLPPVSQQEVWASGVTFERSRTARNEEAGEVDYYDRVYDAQRPELFFKAAPGRVRASGETIGIRPESHWDVPEPELALAVSSRGHIVAYSLGNDVSSRSIEGENPLYLPQAKVYEGSCALGPCLVPIDAAPPIDGITIELRIDRNATSLYHDAMSLGAMHRSCEELVDWLFRGLAFPRGVVLLTGTCIVPPTEFTLAEGDVVTIQAAGIGTLRNKVTLARPRREAAGVASSAPATGSGEQELEQPT